MKLHAAAGKKPAHVKKDVPGFIGNRLQHALWREAIALVEHGICDAETVDTVIKATFGRRLAVLGPAGECRPGRHRPDARHPQDRAADDRQPAGAFALSGKAGDGRQARLQDGRRLPQVDPAQQQALRAKGVAASQESARRRQLNGAPKEETMTDSKTISRRTLVKTGLGALAAPAVLRVLPANAQSAPSRSAMSARAPARSPASARPTPSSSSRCSGIARQGPAESAARPITVEIISKDSQSNAQPRRRGRVRADPARQGRTLIVASATPDTTNPVADQAEVNEVPCITTNCPWQPYFFGRKGDPTKGFTWTYHFFWGLEDVIGAFLALWDDAADQQGGRRPVPQRRRRQCLGRSASSACRRRSPRPATS